MEVISRKLNDIRSRWAFRADADEEGENEEPKKKKHSAFSTRLPYALCKEVGINTEGMTPREAWDAYAGKTGESPKAVKEEKMGDESSGKAGEESVPTSMPTSKPTKEEVEKKRDDIWDELKEFESKFGKEHGVNPSALWLFKAKGKLEERFGDNKEYSDAADKYHNMITNLREAEYESNHYDDPEPKTETWKKIREVEREAERLEWATSDYGERGEEVDKARKNLEKARKEAAEQFASDGYEVEPIDFDGSNMVDVDKRYNELTSLSESVLLLDGADKKVKALQSINSEMNRTKDAFKKKMKKEVRDLDIDSIDTDGLENKSDKELETLVEELQYADESAEDLYGIDVGDDYIDSDLFYDARNEIRAEIRNKVEKVKNEITNRADRDFDKKYGKIGEAVESSPKYTKPVLKEYSAKAPKPKVNTDITSLKDWQSCADEYMEKNALGGYDYARGADKNTMWGLTSEQLGKARDNLQTIFDNADLCLNINSAIVEKVFTGHLKNQFESGTTDGSSDLDARRNQSHNIFGTPLDANNAEREKYGYMADHEDYERTVGDEGPWYGKTGTGKRCCIVFRKDRVKDRTTYTFGDSLAAAYDLDRESFAAGMVDTQCSIEGVSYNERKAKDLASGKAKSIKDMFGTSRYSYLECQYHGGVTAADIDNIRFRSYHDMNNAIRSWGQEALDIAEKNGVRFSYYDKIDNKFVYLDARQARESASKLFRLREIRG